MLYLIVNMFVALNMLSLTINDKIMLLTFSVWWIL